MMHRSSLVGIRQWFLTGAFVLGLSTLHIPAFAQGIPGDPDHLKCYQVLKDENQAEVKDLDLVNKFGLEAGCHLVTKAKLFCTPAAKFLHENPGNGDDPRGDRLLTDFTCYKVQCPPVSKKIHIDDQFGDRDIGIKNARMVCAPTISTPPAP